MGALLSKEKGRALLELARSADHLVLLGDIFDFWFDYPHFRLKGYDALLNALDLVRDAGTRIHFIGGNHDIWAAGYLHQRYGSSPTGDTEIIVPTVNGVADIKYLDISARHWVNQGASAYYGLDTIGVENIILTASGGPFRTFSRADMAAVTPAQASSPMVEEEAPLHPAKAVRSMTCRVQAPPVWSKCSEITSHSPSATRISTLVMSPP